MKKHSLCSVRVTVHTDAIAMAKPLMSSIFNIYSFLWLPVLFGGIFLYVEFSLYDLHSCCSTYRDVADAMARAKPFGGPTDIALALNSADRFLSVYTRYPGSVRNTVIVVVSDWKVQSGDSKYTMMMKFLNAFKIGYQ